ncbi:MAG: hypothetical protein GZ087_12790 [Flavobacterium sp.]|nr:hypothetical protein [Flavobacterium sp.]
MSSLRNKSDINIAAAEHLDGKSIYPPVAHCAYYSCYQFMKHIWLFSMNKTDNDLALLTKNTTEGSHEVLINQITKYLKSKNQDTRSFNTEIVSLKKLRHKSDYDNIEIGSEISANAIKLSKSSLVVLKKCL